MLSETNSESVPKRMRQPGTRVLIAIFAWVVLWAVFFAPILPRSKVLAPLDILETLERPWARTERIEVWNAYCYDAISQYIPYDYAVYKSLRDDGFIGWNPDVHNGTCLRENHMLCPSSLRHVFYRFLPFWDAWDWGRMVHFLLAGIGMILLLRETGLSPIASLLGAIAFSFSSQMVVWIHSDVIASGCCWSPWMLWSLFRLRRTASTPRSKPNSPCSRGSLVLSILLAGAFTGAALRCGFLHTTLFNVSLLVIFLLSGSAVRRRAGGRFECAPVVLAILLGFAIALPWFLDVVPPAIRGGHALRNHSVLDGIKALPTLATSIYPTLLGSPQSLDAMKAVGLDFYDVKFAGCTALILAVVSLFNREAPRFPKILFVLFFVIPFTPLSKWYYHRCFVLSALGLAWLAAWRLDWQTRQPTSPVWKRIFLAFAGCCILWLAASIALQLLEPSLLPKLQDYAIKNLPTSKSGRADWMVERAARFYAEAKIWNPWNIAGLLALGYGLVAASRIRIGNRRNFFAVLFVILATFAELSLFGARIIYPADRPNPSGDSPYADRAWVDRFKSHLGNGSVLFWQSPAKGGRKDFDYMQINAPSAHGIRQAEGYESVQPLRLTPQNRNAFDPDDYARAGISHVSTPHGEPFPNADSWRLVEASPDYDLYENPAFRSIFLARLADGSEVPLFAEDETPNFIRLILPARTQSLRLAATHHPRWRYRLGDGPWHLLPAASDNYRDAEIVFSIALPAPRNLRLQFH